jgi:hypothetical protein
MARLQTGELSAEESFLIATRRIGEGRQLEMEFGKLNRNSVWLDRLLWMLIGLQAWTFATGSIGSITSNLMALGWSNTNYHWREGGITLPVVLFTLVRLLSTGASIWLCWWVIFRKGGRFNQWLRLKLERRSSFIGYSIAVCLLFLSVQALMVAVPMYLRWKFSPAVIGETNMYLNYSQAVVHFTMMIGMIAFTLSLTRKRFLTRST